MSALTLTARRFYLRFAGLRIEALAFVAIFARYFRLWIALGIPAFIALLIVFYLMVAKPI